jgi:precorrin-3B methylase
VRSLTIVGLGIRPIDHLTPESKRAIAKAKNVLFVDTTPGTAAFLQTMCSRVTDLSVEYRSGEVRTGIYRRQAAIVLNAAIEQAPVVFAMHGHPTVFSYVTSLLTAACTVLDMDHKILPGVSSTATILASLGIDPGVQGLFTVEATDLLLRQRPLQPDVPTLIWQIGNVMSRIHHTRQNRPDRFIPFQRYLLRYYAADHPIDIAYSSPHPLVPDSAKRTTVAKLAEHAEFLHPGATLYLPPRHTRPVMDPHLLNLVDDPVFAASLTQ